MQKILNIFSGPVDYFKYCDAKYKVDLNMNSELISQIYVNDCFAWFGAWIEPFNNICYDVKELYVNSLVFKKVRLRELALEEKSSDLEWLLKEISEYKPNILFLNSVSILGVNEIEAIRNAFADVKIVVYVGSPFYTYELLRKYDIVLTNLHSFDSLFRSNKINSHYLPHAFNTNILKNLKHTINKNRKIVFCGNLFFGEHLHNYRLKILQVLVSLKLVDIYGNKQSNYLTNIIKYVLHHLFKFSIVKVFFKSFLSGVYNKVDYNIAVSLKREFPDFNSYAYEPVYGMDYYNLHLNYLAALNVHAGIAQEEAANIRLFEIIGIGCPLLTDFKVNLSDFVDPINDIVTFNSVNEMAIKVNWMLENEEKLLTMAKCAQDKILLNHTFYNRAILFDKILKYDL